MLETLTDAEYNERKLKKKKEKEERKKEANVSSLRPYFFFQ